MASFTKIYLFTTENIKGYMEELDLKNKKIITVTGSGDQVLNAISRGCLDITTFDVNPYAKHILALKMGAIARLSFDEFLEFFLEEGKKTLAFDTIKELEMPRDSKDFWMMEISKYRDGLELRNSSLFNTNHFDKETKIKQNIYLNREDYDIIKNNLSRVEIDFINANILDLKLDCDYDYMFLSNISDYLDNMFNSNYLDNYKKLIDRFRRRVKTIYFAYVYDLGHGMRSDIDDLESVKKIFKNMKIKEIDTAFVGRDDVTKDGVFIIEGEN